MRTIFRTGKFRIIISIYLLILAFDLLQVSILVASELTVTASVDKSVIGLNQQFVLTVEVSGEGANSVNDINLPDTGEFAELLSSGGSSQSIQFVNGRMSVQKSFSYYYRAKKEGTFQFPGASVVHKGKEYSSNTFTMQISRSTAPVQRPTTRSQPQTDTESIEDKLFLKALVNKRRVYQSEQIIVTYKLYFAINVTQIGAAKLPGTAGFWEEEIEIPNPPPTSVEVVNGRRYNVAVIKKSALFPNNSGKMTIEPLGLDCDVRVQQRSRSLFDSFFDDPFFGRTVRQTIFSDPVEIEVLPVPAINRPADFSGVVGNYNITAKVDRDSVTTNETITYTLKITGSGNIKILPNPKVTFPNDFQQYEPKIQETINRTDNGVSGSKTFEYVLIPRFPGIQTIKPVSFTFFNPATRNFEISQTRQFDIRVGKGTESYATLQPGAGVSKEEVVLLGQDIRFIKRYSDDFIYVNRHFYNNPVFLILLLVPFLAIGSAYAYRQHQDKLAENVAYARNYKARSVAMQLLKKSRQFLKEETQKEFYGQVSAAMTEFLGNKLNIASAGIISDEVEELLQAKQVSTTIISSYINCLQFCDYQRFAPSTPKIDEMKKFYQQAELAIMALEKAI